jgi:hypothetical protein
MLRKRHLIGHGPFNQGVHQGTLVNHTFVNEPVIASVNSSAPGRTGTVVVHQDWNRVGSPVVPSPSVTSRRIKFAETSKYNAVGKFNSMDQHDTSCDLSFFLPVL